MFLVEVVLFGFWCRCGFFLVFLEMFVWIVFFLLFDVEEDDEFFEWRRNLLLWGLDLCLWCLWLRRLKFFGFMNFFMGVLI